MYWCSDASSVQARVSPIHVPYSLDNGLGFRAKGVGIRMEGVGCMVYGVWFMLYGVWCKV